MTCSNGCCASGVIACANDGTCGPRCDVCPEGCEFTTLQAAVTAANDGDTIRICPGTYATNNVLIRMDLTIIGAGDDEDGTILDGGGTSRVVQTSDNTVMIQDLTVTRGFTASTGGGIFANGTLTLERVQITNNTAGNSGGGIFVNSGGTLILKGTRIRSNTASRTSIGGGILNFGTVTLDTSRIEVNTANTGGGIYNAGSSSLVNLTNDSSVTGNTATRGPGSGGGIFNDGTVNGATASNVFDNDPDDCVNRFGTGCPPA